MTRNARSLVLLAAWLWISQALLLLHESAHAPASPLDTQCQLCGSSPSPALAGEATALPVTAQAAQTPAAPRASAITPTRPAATRIRAPPSIFAC